MEENKEKEMNVQDDSEQIIPTTDAKENNQGIAPKKSNKGIVIALVVIILLLALALVYVLFFTKNEEKGNDKQEVTPTPSVEPQGTSTPEPNKSEDEIVGGELVVYKNSNGDLCTYSFCAKQQFGEKEAFRIKVNSKDAKTLADEKNRFILYDDDGIKIYDINDNSIKNTNLKDDYDNYEFHISEDNNRVIGIGFTDKNYYMGYYSLSLDKTIYYNKKYEINSFPFLTMVNDNYISIQSKGNAYLLNVNKEKEELEYKSSDEYVSCAYTLNGSKNDYVYFLGCGNEDEWSLYKAYNNELKEFYNKKSTEYNFYKNYIYIGEENSVKKYDTKGNLLFTSKEYDKNYVLAGNYVEYIKDDNVVIENVDDSSEVKTITKWNDDWWIDFVSYYTRDELDEIDEKDKKEGLYIVIYYSDEGSVKDSKGNYGMEYCYTTDKQIIEYPIKEEMGGRAKPVLYLYPTEETNITVKFEKPELLTTTYPKYINSWNVTVLPNGDMHDKNGKYYYALYWDEKRYNEVDFKEGFYVEAKDAISFLEEKLTYIGLSDKERNEFIMYWLPILENNKKNLVYFELTEERESGNKLIITPKLDSLLRVSIHIKKVNSKVNIKEQKLESFNRVGFSAVEWGGMTY